MEAQAFQGVMFGPESHPTAVICPAYMDPDPSHFPAWLKGLEAKGWQVTRKSADDGNSVMVAGVPPVKAHITEHRG